MQYVILLRKLYEGSWKLVYISLICWKLIDIYRKFHQEQLSISDETATGSFQVTEVNWTDSKHFSENKMQKVKINKEKQTRSLICIKLIYDGKTIMLIIVSQA